MGNENTQLETKGTSKLSLSAIPRLFAANPLSLYVPITMTAMWQYALTKTWNHYCETPAAYLYLSLGAVLLVLAVVLAVRPLPHGSRLLKSSPGSWVLAFCFSLIAYGVVVLNPTPQNDLIMGILSSISIAWLYLRCGALYAGLGFERTIICIVFSLIFAALIKMAMYALPEVIVYPLVCSTVLLFEAAYGKAQAARATILHEQATPLKHNLPHTSKGFLLALALEVITFDVIAGFFGTPLLVGYGYIHQLILVAIFLIILAILLKSGPHVRLGLLFEIALLCCLLVFVVLSFTSTSSPVALAVINVPHYIVNALLWLLLVDLENRHEQSPLVVFAAGWGISFFSIGLGQFLAAQVMPANDLPSNFMIVLAFFLATSVVFVFSKFATYDTFSSYAIEEEYEKQGIDYSEIEERCRSLGEAFGLTKREVEIVQLIAKGRSRGFIASSLVISENTVKGHTRNAYGKLGIHSKQELLTLIESQ